MLLYQRGRGQAASHLVVRPAPLLLADAPHVRYGIELVLARPQRGWFSSSPAAEWPF
jgi:hypothetical protein